MAATEADLVWDVPSLAEDAPRATSRSPVKSHLQTAHRQMIGRTCLRRTMLIPGRMAGQAPVPHHVVVVVRVVWIECVFSPSWTLRGHQDHRRRVCHVDVFEGFIRVEVAVIVPVLMPLVGQSDSTPGRVDIVRVTESGWREHLQSACHPRVTRILLVRDVAVMLNTGIRALWAVGS